MNRKEFVTKTAVALTTVGAVSNLFAEDHTKHEMSGGKSSSKYAKALMSAIHCKLAAEVCLGHCITELGNGDKSLGACAKSTREVIAACEAFISLASQESAFTKKSAALCLEICEACAKECKKHADHHKVCKECLDSCLACAKEMAKV
ncbi:four-helix bundle copper-binding protein [Leptospira idonii]|uniref:Four-helix bundle copper-binding protein n=1 Tax=Leptospira idonii TaxID=1193500 RepID=A0A4R9LZ82_9LEPT|nr:four-helix bundle copper-binding protein [Leptospira idonii]TGN19663.1 four-helix bundle copper-binding protein [Leptospira idonii]